MISMKKVLRYLDKIIFQRDRVDIDKLKKYKYGLENKKLVMRPELIKNISVIVPCYNHSKYLNDALNSIINQTRLPDEIILIDDNSQDSTFEELKKFYDKHSKTTNIVIRRNKSNLGQCATINIGVASASSNLIMILNDDDYLMHDAVEHTLKIFNDNNDIYLLGSKSLYVYRQEHFANLKKLTFDSIENRHFLIRKIYPEEVEKFVTGREIDMAHSGSSFLKIAWETVGGYISKLNKRVIMYSDRDFQLRVNSVFPIAIIENAAFTFWRINSSVDAGIYS